MNPELREAAERWLAEDPDPATRDELRSLLDAGDEAAVTERFAGRLEFGTAPPKRGLRGERRSARADVDEVDQPAIVRPLRRARC